MAIKTAHITWQPVSGSTGYLVQYKLQNSLTYTTPTSPPNPTLATSYDIQINSDTFYDVLITSNGANCSPRGITIQIFAPSGQCCPPGYILSTDGTLCTQTNTTAATPPSAGENTVAAPLNVYSQWGTLIYNPGYNTNGTGAFTQIPFFNAFWVNGIGYPNIPGTVGAGPMNRAALWATTLTDNQTIGFTTCITVPEDKVYYVGIGGDNIPFIKLDGNIVVEMDPNAMGNYLAVHGYPQIIVLPSVASEATFYWWHIYPVFITAGAHVLEMSCNNTFGPAGMAAEIYNATVSEIMSAASYADLGAKLIFSTKDFIGQPVQIGTGGIGYTCPDNFSLVLCSGPAFCQQILSAPTIDCAEVDIIYYNFNDTGVPPIAATILASPNITGDGQLDVPIDYEPFNAAPHFLWVAIPNNGPSCNKNQWFVDLLNQGAIGGVSNLFGNPTHVTVSGQDYFVWITNYETQFVAPVIFQKV